jgi:hypothetical protein
MTASLPFLSQVRMFKLENRLTDSDPLHTQLILNCK